MRKKPFIFSTVTHGPFSVNIQAEPSSGFFVCQFGGKTMRDPVFAVVRRWAVDCLKRTSALDWQPVMAVNFDKQDQSVNGLKDCTNLRCWLDRFYASWDGLKWVKTPWVVMPANTYLCAGSPPSERRQEDYPMPPEELMQQRVSCSQDFHAARGEGSTMRWPLLEPSSLGDCTYYVPYTEENWAVMLGILNRMRELRAGIAHLLSSHRGMEQLAKVAHTRLISENNTE